MKERIGFMQGRLTDKVDGKIQAFPWNQWREEFSLASQAGFNLMEWTLDQDRLYENPLMTKAGQNEIKNLCHQYHMSIPSLTGDCFMQAPFWKSSGPEKKKLQQDFNAIVKACSLVGIGMIVVPFVDQGRLENQEQEEEVVDYLKSQKDFLKERRVTIIFESDFNPKHLAQFIGRLDDDVFGINYDIGNSASLGFNPKEEISTYGQYIKNVHVKDRLLGGTTVPLGKGAALFETIFSLLKKINYKGNYILQTARADDGHHVETLCLYRNMTLHWLNDNAA